MTAVTRADVVATARGYLGVRWQHQGRSRAGLDCLGLVVVVAHQLGLSRADVRDYGRLPGAQRLRDELARHLVPVREQQPGDVLLLRFERNPLHVAIVTPAGIVHAYANQRRVVEHRIDQVWRERVVRCYAFPGVA
jgi:cell wall-associated NlpC family hydrolase